jgi:toxin ParE1/3/4
MRLAFAEAAALDTATIVDFVAQSEPRQARKTAAAIRRAAEQLARHPHLGRSGRIMGTRELILADYPYILVYTADKDTVTVVAVFHDARDIVGAMRGRKLHP